MLNGNNFRLAGCPVPTQLKNRFLIGTNNLVPLVSVCCVTYNHEKFIRDCLDGFIRQQTNFPFEVLIHEDASTDSTADIVREYEERYPQLFRCVYQTENQFLKQNVLLNILFKMAKGRYIALCEGDDFWIDPAKLQKQVDILRSDLDCILTFHNTLDVTTEESKPKYSQGLKDRFYIQDFVHFFYARTVSMLFRNPERGLPIQFQYMRVADWPIAIWLMQFGSARYIPEVMAAYRIHNAGNYTRLSSSKKAIQVYESFRLLSKAMSAEYKPLVTEKLYELSFSYFFGSIRIIYFKGIIIGFWYILRSPFALKIRKIRNLLPKR
jgi:glycosyltransferase involved in cell wall biosynthesis